MVDMIALREKNGWSLHCNFCGKDVFKHPLDYFMVKDEVWHEVCDNDYVDPRFVLCRHCVEEILGRKLLDEDFIDAPVNYDYPDNETRILKNRLYKLED